MIRKLLIGGALILSGSLPALGADVTCPGEGEIKSASTSINTEITFTNDSGAPRQIFWIDFGGARVQYGNIKPGATHVQPTFLGHAWLIADGNADCLGLYFADTVSRSVSLSAVTSGPVPGPVSGVPPRDGNPPVGGNPPGGQVPVADDGSPCSVGEYWNRSRNLCINTTTKNRRKPSALPVVPDSPTVRTLRCRPGYVQNGNRCVRQSGAAPQPQSPNQLSAIRAPIVPDDADNEENRPDDLCGPGFTDIGGGCISNSLLNNN
ncbi:MAG: hypothetical protein ACC634_08020 [Hyphomicrobiales bacterium]